MVFSDCVELVHDVLFGIFCKLISLPETPRYVNVCLHPVSALLFALFVNRPECGRSLWEMELELHTVRKCVRFHNGI